ncbi:MAG: type III-A CRISPR-associated RAMP protein Csm3 [Desulfococcaceae bacterium]
MKLESIKEIKGKIILKSGLHIGAGDTEMRIGGTDNPVVKHPHTQEPYIPGSSIKGKVRSLLEMRSGLMRLSEGKPLSANTLKELRAQGEKLKEKSLKDENVRQEQECALILRLFGAGAGDSDEDIAKELGPTRVSFADCPLNRQWKKKASADMLPFIEVKSENQINRIKGTALNPRFTERVPADTIFDFSISLKILERDEDLETLLLEGLRLLEMDALGGNGSRGYGRISFAFENETIREKYRKVIPLNSQTSKTD